VVVAATLAAVLELGLANGSAAAPGSAALAAGTSLRETRQLAGAYSGALAGLVQDGSARPLSLAAADLDHDGVPDLVTGYVSGEQGLLTVHKGNLDAIYPNGPAALERKARGAFTDSPFLSPAQVLALPSAPDFLETGDFDEDGHRDVVVAARGGDAFHLLRGDGRGGFGQAQTFALPGGVTALASGPFGRANGLANVVVAVRTARRSQLLVFESRRGGLRLPPLTIDLPAAPTALACGRFDGDAVEDLAAAAGRVLLVVHGRLQPSAPPAAAARQGARILTTVIDRIPFASPLAAVVAGEFRGARNERAALAVLGQDGAVRLLGRAGARGLRVLPGAMRATRQPLAIGAPSTHALVPARVLGGADKDLVAIDAADRRLRVLSSASRVAPSLPLPDAPVAVLAMRLNGDALSDLVVLEAGQTEPTLLLTAPAKVFVVNSAADTPDGILGDGKCDTGTPSTGETGICTLRAALVESDMTADLDEIDFNITSADRKISVNGGQGSLGVLRPVLVDGTTQPGDHSVLVDGTDAGSVDDGGGEVVGFELVGQDSTIRGLEIANFERDGFRIRNSGGPVGNNIVEGNLIAFNGRHGIHVVEAANNLLGGTNDTARNQVIKNKADGVHIEGSNATDNRVQGNTIGTSKEMSSDGSNEENAIVIDNAPGTTVGEPAPGPPKDQPSGASNVIVGKKKGVDIEGLLTTSTKTKVNGNFFGLPAIDAELAAGLFANGSLFTAGGNVFTKVSDAEIEAFVNLSGDVDIRHSRFVAKALAGTRITFAPDREVTFEFQDNEIKEAGKGLVGEEMARARVTWEVLGTKADAKETVYSLIFRGAGEKKFGPDPHLSAEASGTFVATTQLDAGVSASLLLNGMISDKSGQDGTLVQFEGKGIVGVTVLDGRNTNNGRDAYRWVAGAGFDGRATVDMHRVTGSVSGEAGLFAVNQTSVISALTVFVEKSFFDKDIKVGVNLFKTGSRGHSIDDNVITDCGTGVLLTDGSEADLGGNTISGNGVGIAVEDTSQAAIVGNTLTANGPAVVVGGTGAGTVLSANSIFGNSGLGIDLGNDGPTPNDPGDADTGPDNLQNFPVLTSATSTASATTIIGSLDSTPNTAFRLEFFSNRACNPSGFGEGETFLGSVSVGTDAGGNAPFSATVPAAVAGGEAITATATDPGGNTSEFSACIAVGGGGTSGIPDAITALIAKVKSFHLTRGLETILVGRLQGSLEAFNLGDNKASTNLLGAFIGDVKTHRGTGIPVAQADELIADAQAILDMFGIPDLNFQ
jgi:CSLREA domain-containing protein